MRSREEERPSRARRRRGVGALLHFFALFCASYAIGVIFLHFTAVRCKNKRVEELEEAMVPTPSRESEGQPADSPENKDSDSSGQWSSRPGPGLGVGRGPGISVLLMYSQGKLQVHNATRLRVSAQR